MSIDRKTRAFVKELQRAYFEMRDTEKILSMATEDVLWSGLYHSNIHAVSYTHLTLPTKA